jgi:hypothetical protein
MNATLLQNTETSTCSDVETLQLRDLANIEVVLVGGGDITGSTY